MAFAPINDNLSYWQKQNQPLFSDLSWNIPERKTGRVSIVGGNSQNLTTVIQISEYLGQNFPFESIKIFLPDAVRNKLPPLPSLNFCRSTSSGSFDKSPVLNSAFEEATLLIGDLSKNAVTAIAIHEAIQQSSESKTLFITRDAVDLLTPEIANLLLRPRTFIMASILQLQKICRTIYYPKMILLSQPLIPIIETLHKFSLTYPATIITFHEGSIIIATQGKVTSTHLVDTSYSPITLWSGQLAANIFAMNFYNPDHPLEASTAAILYKK